MAEAIVDFGRVSCVRDFPKGCGPHCLGREPKETKPPYPFPPPSRSSVVQSPQSIAYDAVVAPSVGTFAVLPLVEVDKNVSTRNMELRDDLAFAGRLDDLVGGSSMKGSGNTAAAGVKEELEAGQRIQGSTSEYGKSGPLQLTEYEIQQSQASILFLTDGSFLADDNMEMQRSSKLHPLSQRSAVLAVRNFPIGCGVSSRMTRGQPWKLEGAASSKGISPIEEKQLTTDLQPIVLKDMADNKDPADNVTTNGIEEMLLARDIKEESVEDFRVETEVLKYNILYPISKCLEAANEILVEQEDVSGGNLENKVLCRVAPDKRSAGKSIVSISNHPEAQMSKLPSPDNLASKRPSMVKSTDKLLMKSQKTPEFMRRKFSGKTEDTIFAGIGPKLDYGNLEAYGEKLITQDLMAAPHCPWRQVHTSGASGSCPPAKAQISRMKREQPASDMQLALSRHKLKSHRTASNMQPSLSKLKRQRTTLNMKLDLPKLNTESTTLGLQNVFEEVGDEDFSSHREENERAFVRHEGSFDQGVAAPPLAVYKGYEELCVPLPPTDPGWNYIGCDRPEAVARYKVRRVLKHFQVLCRKLLQSEEAKPKGSGKIKRVDMTAAQMLKQKGEWVNASKPTIGIVPGVEVGDEFQYRVELSIVGLHRPFQGGIDGVRKDGLYVASSIVASGVYDDDMDSSDVLIYSGSGGNPGGPDKPPEDQKLERGNLGLKNCIESKTPVRVIHGIKELKGGNNTKPKLVSTFTYAGLYLVDRYWQEKGPYGFSVFKFQLVRMPGQPELALHEVKRSKKLKVREGLCVKDISNGKEKIPICAINTVNDELPPPFRYITRNKYLSWYTKTPPKGCGCTKGCSKTTCACAVKNGGEIPFNHGGAIVMAKPLVYECGPSCECPPSCYNRVSQHGIQIPLEIFRTERRGWGVRSLYSIPSGTFVCEYIGELLNDNEAEQRTNDEYLFDVGHNYDDHSLWKGLPCIIPDLMGSYPDDTVDAVSFTIDAAEYGNVGRFINHSCSPNLYAQNVLYDHDDKRMPHIMLFAAENIPPLQELTYHYNYTIDEVRDAEGNIKRKDCYCGSHGCTGRLY